MFSAQDYSIFVFPAMLPALILLGIKLLKNQFLGLKLVVFMSIFTTPIVGSVHGSHFFNIQIWQLLMLIVFSFLLMKILLTSGIIKKTFLHWPLLLLLFSYLVSVFNSDYPMDSLRQLIKIFFVNVLLYFVVINLVDNLSKVDELIKVIFGTAYVVFLVAIVQLVSYHLFGVNLFYRALTLRPTSTFTEAGWFPIYMSYILSIILAVFAYNKENAKGILWILIILSLLIGKTRAPVIASLATLMTYVFIYRQSLLKSLKIITYVGVAASATVIIMFFFAKRTYLGIAGRFFQDYHRDFSTLQRLAYMNTEIRFIKEHPFIGNGVGTWSAKVIPASGIKIVQETVLKGGSAHNIFLGICYDAGMAGAAAFFLVLFIYFRQIWRLRRLVPKSSTDNVYLDIAFLLPVCLLVNSLFSPVYLAGFSMIAFALCAAILNLLRTQHTQRQAQEK